MQRIVFGDEVIDDATLARRVGKVAGWLTAQGLKEGDVVAFMLRNEPVFVEMMLAAQQLGVTIQPVNWHLSGADLQYVLDDAEALMLVVHADILRGLHGIQPRCPVWVVPTPEAVRIAYKMDGVDCTVPAGFPDWSIAIAETPPMAAIGARARTAPTLIYTSGTTGKPKGVLRPSATADQTTHINRMLRDVYGTSDKQVLLAVAPLYHAAPFGVISAALRVSGTIVIQPRFHPEELLALIERHRVTHVFMVPVMFSRLLALNEATRSKYDVRSLQWVLHGAAPCPPDQKRKMIEWWGPIINEYYGATELGPIALSTSAEWMAKPGTVGRPVEGARIVILDENGETAKANIQGEIFCRQTLYPDFTYKGLPDKREEVERDDLITLGDIGMLDTDGYLFVTDRKRDMLISGGVNIYPAEIEEVLNGMPGVLDCAVFGIPDAEFGEAVCAYIQVIPEEDISRESIIEYLRTRIASYKRPKKIEFAATLPREESGKIFKRKLREKYWEKTGRLI